MTKRRISFLVPLSLAVALAAALAGGAQAMDEGTCDYSVPAGTCSSTTCGGEGDPLHECVIHAKPTAHCDCVPIVE
jgi:hypothetical protein